MNEEYLDYKNNIYLVIKNLLEEKDSIEFKMKDLQYDLTKNVNKRDKITEEISN